MAKKDDRPEPTALAIMRLHIAIRRHCRALESAVSFLENGETLRGTVAIRRGVSILEKGVAPLRSKPK